MCGIIFHSSKVTSITFLSKVVERSNTVLRRITMTLTIRCLKNNKVRGGFSPEELDEIHEESFNFEGYHEIESINCETDQTPLAART
jgi:hypothetical protein